MYDILSVIFSVLFFSWLIRCFGEVKRVVARRVIGGVLFLVSGCCGRIEKTRGSSVAFLARYHGVAGATIAAATKILPSY